MNYRISFFRTAARFAVPGFCLPSRVFVCNACMLFPKQTILWNRIILLKLFWQEDSRLSGLIHQLKYNNKKEIGVLLGKLFGKDLTGSEFILPIDLIIPVPLHPQKQKERGFNQAETIAHGLSEATSIPVSSGNLVRSIFNPTQTQRTKTQRWENVKGIFDLLHPSLYAGKHILLVDDIITTGSTLEACAHALLKSPGIKISVATLGEVF